MPNAREPPHDFPDQAIRDQLQNPANLRDLQHEVLGELADGFVCAEREILEREFPLEDWRHRESDVLFRIPYKAPADTVPVFVCVLLEHQSRHNPIMPLRTAWQPLFLDLAGKTPAELVEAAGEWLNALARVRADNAESDAFRALLEQVLRRLEGLADRDPVRWHELMRFSLQWALYRRPGREREHLIVAAHASQTNVARLKEVQAVTMTIAETWKAEGKAESRLDEAREMLQGLLEEKFGTVPETVRQRIQAVNDLTRLHAGARADLHLAQLEQFEL